MKATFNIEKLQKDVLAAAAKRELNGKFFNLLHGNVTINNGKFTVISDGCAAWFIPSIYYYLDNERVFAGRSPYNFDKYVERAETAAPVYDTGIITELNDGGKDTRKCRVLRMESGEEIWIDTVFLRYFDISGIRFTGTGPKAPVYCYCNEWSLIGLILPVNHTAPARPVPENAPAETVPAPAETVPAETDGNSGAKTPVETATENAGETVPAEETAPAPKIAPGIEKSPTKSGKQSAKAEKKSKKAPAKAEAAPAPVAAEKSASAPAYEIKDGTKPGANEVYFANKPPKAVRDKLIGLRMRWNNLKKCWYGYVERADILAAIQAA